MTDKDKLIKLIHEAEDEYMVYEMAEQALANGVFKSREEYIADYLIANGVILLPCKVGNVVYCLIQGFENPLKATIKRIVIQADGVIISCSVLGYFGQSYMATDFGKTIFLTKEEAERALERNKDNTDGVII